MKRINLIAKLSEKNQVSLSLKQANLFTLEVIVLLNKKVYKFRSDLDDAFKTCKSQEIVIMISDLTAKVGLEKYMTRDTFTESAREVSREEGKTTKKMCLEAKEKWLNDKCKIIEKIKNSNTNALYKNIKEITEKRACTVSQCKKLNPAK
ncbi:hypothetical protein HELRODRAFT_165398 [Helobdella robusta]|uniref:Uncharacterized protein n=1 Tax=Helobdella robusta TaxID=6412 RepID=T1EWQ0_HELRO|nr:hypothetical protein HELRODRAFT_165398 [Helobdella robusta]ESN91368.1 hypothetical protein HELRODRAFT_165398 [Helobdella robusta]